jgi:hypothetical protein
MPRASAPPNAAILLVAKHLVTLRRIVEAKPMSNHKGWINVTIIDPLQELVMIARTSICPIYLSNAFSLLSCRRVGRCTTLAFEVRGRFVLTIEGLLRMVRD